MARIPKDLHVIIKADTTELKAALQAVIRAAKAHAAIAQCPELDPIHGLPCLLQEGHLELEDTDHRARYLHGVPVQVEWLTWS